jgi:SpoVK/Ycf46/Vps4 family AAA+-type ATPase
MPRFVRAVTRSPGLPCPRPGLRVLTRPKRGATLVRFAGKDALGRHVVATALARALDAKLYRVDPSGVASKYIGETEKNLGAVFWNAERSGALLFFDEADALFGRRTSVKAAHDRYANLETGYLLQRLERYRGVAILATNSERKLAPALIPLVVGLLSAFVACRRWRLAPHRGSSHPSVRQPAG